MARCGVALRAESPAGVLTSPLMSSRRIFFLLVLIACVAANTSAQTSGRFDVSRLDTTCKPCDDFYQFVNGNWIKDNPVPPAFSRWGTFQILQEENLKTLREILEDASRSNATAGTNEQIVGSFYGSCMDQARIDALGASPLSDDFAAIEKIRSIQDLQTAIARLHQTGLATLFAFGASYDLKDSSRMIAWAVQGGLSLPNKDFYTDTDEKSKQTREDFVKHVGRMFELLGDSPDKAAKTAEAVMRIEKQLADVSMTPVERRDPATQYNKRTLAELRSLTPDWSWSAYLAARG